MKIFLTGATGVVGTRALPRLVAADHDVTAVARTDEKAALIEQLGGTPVRCDLFDPTAVTDAVVGNEAVINLATHIPPVARAARRSSWATNDRLRTEASANLIAAALASGVERFVQESICFSYADHGDSWVDEDAPRTENAVTASASAAEGNAARIAEAGGAAVVLRFAQFYSADSEHVSTFQALARRRIPPLPGDPGSYASFIHAEDAGAAVAAAVGAPAGTYNIGDDQPLTRSDANAVIARVGGSEAAHPAAGRAVCGWRPSHCGTSCARSGCPTGGSSPPPGGPRPTPRSRRAGPRWCRHEDRPAGRAGDPGRHRPGDRPVGGVLPTRASIDGFPGLGRTWVAVDGPYNQHLVGDVGTLYLGLAVIGVAALISRHDLLIRVFGLGSLVFGLPHLVYHLRHTEPLGASDNVLSLGGLAVAVACALLCMVGSNRAEDGSTAMRHRSRSHGT